MPHSCPRRGEPNPVDYFDPSDDTCSYCGSLDPAIFMARLEAGDVELGPTDKSYKVYVHNRGGAVFHQTYGERVGDEVVMHTREMNETKFYFMHLDTNQRKRFVQLLNEKKLHVGCPGHFYQLPFFLKRGDVKRDE